MFYRRCKCYGVIVTNFRSNGEIYMYEIWRVMSQQDKGKSFLILYRSAEQERNYNTCCITTWEECKKETLHFLTKCNIDILRCIHIYQETTPCISDYFAYLEVGRYICCKWFKRSYQLQIKNVWFRDQIYSKDTNFIAQKFY